MVTESQRILQAAEAAEVITDGDGREILVRRLGRRELMRAMRGWGPACNVEMWFGMAVAAASVRAIDGKPVPFPQTPDQVETLNETLGDTGLQAVQNWYQDQPLPDINEAKENAKN